MLASFREELLQQFQDLTLGDDPGRGKSERLCYSMQKQNVPGRDRYPSPQTD